jgi:hypothetical protein
MAITVGTDTYLSLTDATAYVAANYVTTSTKYIAWTALSDGNKEICLKKACKKIDRQILQGVKSLTTQTLEFPRALYTDYSSLTFPNLNIRAYDNWVIETAVHQNVKDAQVEEALSILTFGENANKRVDLQNQGVKSIKLGNLSETYNGKVTSGTKLLSVEALELLRYWLNGSVVIR